MRLIAKHLKGKGAQLVLGPLFKLLEAVLELLVPVVMARLIDEGIRGDVSAIWQNGLVLAALAAGGVLSALICQYFAARTAGHFGLGLREQLYAHVMRLSGAETARFGAGGLITRITNDANQMQTGLNMLIRLGVRVPFLIIGGLVMALGLNWRIGLIFLAASPLIGLVLFVIMRKTLPSYGKMQAMQDDLARLSGENLAGARVIRAFSRQRDEAAEFDAAAGELTDLTVRVGRVSAAMNPVTGFIVAGATVGIVYLGGLFTYQGQSTPGEVFAMVSYMHQILLAMIVAANLIVLFTRAAASTRRVAALLRVQPSVADGPGATPAPAAPAIEFRRVDFAYHEGAGRALEGVSFCIARGATVGVIGGTGSGKTTLVNLMLRHFDATGGAVLCGGADVRAYTLHALREKFGVVPQTPALLSGTVRHNLTLGAPQAADEALWRALRAAQAAEFVEAMDGGLDAEVREGGKNLSGGQRQRLAIARALARQPEILVLDDAASALDYATEARLRGALGAWAREGERPMTTVLISQRAASMRGADAILVLDDGQLAGVGRHEELLAENEVYRQICISQGLVSAQRA